MRERRHGIKRADYIIITKCPEHLEENEKRSFLKRLKVDATKVFFSKIIYGPLIQKNNNALVSEYEVTVIVTGIAQPTYLNAHFKSEKNCILFNYPDHHLFTEKELQTIHQKVANFAPERCRVITTEKDWVKWEKLKENHLFQQLNWFIQPIVIQIDTENKLKQIIKNYVASKR